MKIGIDAKWYFNGPVSTRVILQNLLPVLLQSNPQHHWFIFLDQKDKDKVFPFKQPNITVVYVWTPTNMLANLFILPSRAVKLGLDVVVFQTFPGIKKGFKSIAFIHDILFKEYKQFFTWRERLYFIPMPFYTRRAHRLIATTRSVANDLVEHKFAGSLSMIDLVPLAVNPGFKPLALHKNGLTGKIKVRYHLPGEFLLYVGRLNARKNIEALVTALPLLHNKTIPLVIVGKEDWKKPVLDKLLCNPQLSGRIIMTGTIAEEELVIIYAMAKIFCFPSFAEGFGLPPLEAMASGVPVIVSNTTSLPEVCGNGALYIDPARPESIAHAINELLENKELYKTIQQNGIARAAGFTWNIAAEKLMESISKVIKNNQQ